MPTGVYLRTELHRKRIGERMKNNTNGFQKGNTLNLGKKNALGYKHTEKAKENIRKTHTGEKNWRWNPNREELKRNLRNDGEYKQWVKKVKKKDNNVCRLKDKNCAGYNIAHHIKSWSEYPELRYEVNNGITLCQAHHPKTRAEEKRLEPVLMALVSVSSE